MDERKEGVKGWGGKVRQVVWRGRYKRARWSGERMRAGSVLSAAVFIVTRLYPLNKQRKRLLICNSRKVAKTELSYE